MGTVLAGIRKELQKNIDKEAKVGAQYFFKEEIRAYGVKMPLVQNISKEFFKQLETASKKDIFAVCDSLWKSGYLEEGMIACHWSYFLRKQYQPQDFNIYKRWIKNYVTNWATCDTLCNHTVGEFLEKYPDYIIKLKAFTASPNRWMRRAAAVSLIVPARKGLFINELFEIATALLEDKEDLVQKGYGWMLKSACKHYEKEVFEFVMTNKEKMPRKALRYAIEKMPEQLKRQAMMK